MREPLFSPSVHVFSTRAPGDAQALTLGKREACTLGLHRDRRSRRIFFMTEHF